MLRVACLVLGAIAVATTALPLVRSDEWWIRVWDFPRLQIAAVLAVVLLAFARVARPRRLRDALFLAALVGSLGYQVVRIYPYTPVATTQVRPADSCDPARSLRLLIANVLMSNRQADRLLALVRAHDPDVILAVETDDWWDERLGVLDRDYPFAVKQPMPNTYGMHLFSRLPLVSPEVRFLVERDVPSISTGVRLRSGERVDVHGVHPRPPQPRQDTEERDAEILIVGKEVKAAGRPAVVAGDLNDVAWSHTTRLFLRISGLLDPRIGRGMFNTFHAGYPFLRWPLDHVFLEESFTLETLQRLDFFGSDHFPVLTALCYTPQAAATQHAPPADAEDREEAQEMIEDGRDAGD